MGIDLQESIRTDTIANERTRCSGVSLHMLRLDEIHPLVSGNKWFKLKYNIAEAMEQGCTSLLTFGGPWSNHLVATAAAAYALGLRSVGIVRGLPGKAPLTASLQDCRDMGMELCFVERSVYAHKTAPGFLAALEERFPGCYIVPEGGNNAPGRKGTKEIASFIGGAYTHVALAIGTGATFAGIREALPANIHMLGFPVMKGGGYLEAEIRRMLPALQDNWTLCTDYHFGGFAKADAALLSFIERFGAETGIPLDRVYTAKMMYGVMERIGTELLPAGSRILCIHTGGLQGNRTLPVMPRF